MSLTGRLVTLRPQTAEDFPALYAQQQADVEAFQLFQVDPWRPVSFEAFAARRRRREEEDDPAVASFAIDVDGRLVGGCSLWGIDLHSRLANIGLSLAATERGRGYGTDTVALLVDYAFRLRGLHRVQVETFESNAGMRRVAERTGFRLEGTLRENGWLAGRFVHSVVYGRLATDPAPGT